MKTALIFPGQGSQFVGMGESLLRKHPESINLLQQANDVLGFDIAYMMKQGDAQQLKKTKITQNAVFIYSIACLPLVDVHTSMAAGHSLGEFTALVAAGVISFQEGLRIVHTRASAMHAACQYTPSTMAAVLGMKDEQVDAICRDIKSEVVVPANYNCPGQVVISGSAKGIEIASNRLKEAGAKRVLPLAVGGAFHSPLMAEATSKLEQVVSETTFRTPHFPIYQNITARPITDTDVLKRNVIDQLTRAVRWSQSITEMVKDGATQFIEVGPGKVLQGLVKKIVPHITVSSVDDEDGT